MSVKRGLTAQQINIFNSLYLFACESMLPVVIQR